MAHVDAGPNRLRSWRHSGLWLSICIALIGWARVSFMKIVLPPPAPAEAQGALPGTGWQTKS